MQEVSCGLLFGAQSCVATLLKLLCTLRTVLLLQCHLLLAASHCCRCCCYCCSLGRLACQPRSDFVFQV
jgi:hypothetical protein